MLVVSAADIKITGDVGAHHINQISQRDKFTAASGHFNPHAVFHQRDKLNQQICKVSGGASAARIMDCKRPTYP